MDQKTLWQQYQSLPDEVQQQVTDFLLFLHQKYGSVPSDVKQHPSLTEEPFVGMWRADVAIDDSSTWVRKVRKDEWRDDTD
jgi:hypothetical protein